MYPRAGEYAASVVHAEDAAQLYLQALQHAKAGQVYHCTDGSATGQEIAQAIAAKHKLPVKSISKAESEAIWGPVLSLFFTMASLDGSSKARKELAWRPRHEPAEFLQAVAGQLA